MYSCCNIEANSHYSDMTRLVTSLSSSRDHLHRSRWSPKLIFSWYACDFLEKSQASRQARDQLVTSSRARVTILSQGSQCNVNWLILLTDICTGVREPMQRYWWMMMCSKYRKGCRRTWVKYSGSTDTHPHQMPPSWRVRFLPPYTLIWFDAESANLAWRPT